MQLESIQDHARTGVLELLWDDGRAQQLGHAFLRGRCRCSACQNVRLRTRQDPAVAPDIRIREIRPVGSYGMQLIFSDGHERGIYPWEYLRELADDARPAWPGIACKPTA